MDLVKKKSKKEIWREQVKLRNCYYWMLIKRKIKIKREGDIIFP